MFDVQKILLQLGWGDGKLEGLDLKQSIVYNSTYQLEARARSL